MYFFLFSFFIIILLAQLLKTKELFNTYHLTKDDFKFIFINLDNDITKKKKLTDDGVRMKLNFNRFNAINGNLLTKQDKINLVINKYITNSFLNNKTNGQLGCAISHFKNLEENKNINKHLIVFEDDAIINSDFNNNFDIFLKTLPDDWDMFYLYINNFYLNEIQEKRGRKQRLKINEYVYKPIAPIGLMCYGVNKYSISKILHLLKPLDNTPIDNKLSILIDEGKINAYTPPKNIIEHPTVYYSNTFQRHMSRNIL